MELLVGGEDHKTGQDGDAEAYVRLQAWTRERFPQVESFHAAWSGQVLEPADGLAFIGADPHHDNVWLITGDSGNGMTHGTDRKSTRLNSSHVKISYAVFCLKK